MSNASAAGGGVTAGIAGSSAVGTRVGGYRLEKQLGRGGMAVVYLARDDRLDRLVALKVLAPTLAADEAFRTRFIQESYTAAAVDDPHIIPVFEAGQAGGLLYIAMRYVPGGDVGTIVRRDGPLPADRAAAAVWQVASALDAAHAAGLVHRDVKPANMLVDVRPGRSDHVYLSDFGLSKKTRAASAGLTGTGQLLGTLDYMAPEQIQGRPVDGRTDQYGLACSAFELLTGAAPFPHDEEAAVMYAHLSESPPPVGSRRADLPPGLDPVLARALAKAPASRYPSCQEFADALLQALGTAPHRFRIPASEEPALDRLSAQATPASDRGVVGGTAADQAVAGPGAGPARAASPSPHARDDDRSLREPSPAPQQAKPQLPGRTTMIISAPGGTAGSNPFTYGNPISEPRRFFGRTREIGQIFGRLRNAEFESSSVVGDRRIGKTSLLNYLADPGVRAAHDLDPGRYNFVYVDLQMVDEAMGPEQLWRRLLVLMRRQCADDEISAAAEALQSGMRLDTFDLDELFQKVDDRGQHVVFLLDEFEHVTANANFGPAFYYGLRSLVIHHKLALVTSSRLELVELCHSDAVKSSPFFNIFANINLGMFSSADCQLMVARSLSGTAVQFSEAEVAQVLDMAGLHPFFLQAACCMLYESHRLGLDEAARQAFLAEKFRAEAIPHIVDYWDNSSDHEKIALTAAALLEHAAGPGQGFTLKDLQRVFSRGEPSVGHLEKRGLLICADDRCRLFSSVLGPWILSQIAAEPGEVQGYHEWLAQNRGSVERATGKQGSQLKEILPRIGTRYRQLILTWASDPQTVAAMADLLKTVPSLAS